MSPRYLATPVAKALDFARPYLELMRVDKPVGILNIFFPYGYGYLFASLTAQPMRPLTELFPWPALGLAFSTFLLRSMGCAWNDIVDMNIDRSVQRTKNRPMARGAISKSAACGFTFGLFVSWIAILVHSAPPDLELFSYATPLMTLVVIYPYTKQFTSYAQVILGVTLAWGVIFGAAFGGLDVIRNSPQANNSSAGPYTVNADTLLGNPRVMGLGTLCATYLIWTVLHDTIYAFQDLCDDKRIGINSMATRLTHHAKLTLAGLSISQVTFLAYTAKMIQSSLQKCTTVRTPLEFLVIAVLGNAVLLFIIVLRVDLKNPQSCGRWFRSGCVLVGSSIGLGLLAQYIRILRTVS